MFRVRGIGVAVSVNTSTSVRKALSLSLSRTPKRCSSSITTSPRSLNRGPALQQALGGDDDVDAARGHAGKHSFRLLVAAKARQAFDPHRPVREAIDEGGVVLLGEQGGRHHTATCLPAWTAMKAARSATSVLPKPTSPQMTRSMGLPDFMSSRTCSMAAAWSAVSSKGETGLEGAIFGLAGLHRRALPRRAARIQIQQFRGHIADALRGLAARLLPFARRPACAGAPSRPARRCSATPGAAPAREHTACRRPHTRAPGTRPCIRRRPWSAAPRIGRPRRIRAPPARRCAGRSAP